MMMIEKNVRNKLNQRLKSYEHAVIDNKQLWHFNLISEVTPNNQVEVWKCFDFKIDFSEV